MLVLHTQVAKGEQGSMARAKFRLLVSKSWLVGFLLVLIWLGLRASALYYQADAGRRLATVQAAVPNNMLEDYSNALSSFPPGSAEQITQAIVDLQTSLKYNSDDSQTYLLLGRAYLLLGQADQAIEAYRNYIRLRPGNPLGHLGLGFAREAQCRSQIANSAAASGCPGAVAEWRAAGIDASQLLAAGDSAFNRSQWSEAADWYERARWYAGTTGAGGQVPFDLLFRQAVAAALAQRREASELLAEVQGRDGKFQAYILQDSVRIDGVEFRWMTLIGDGKDANYGTPLSNGGSGTAGFLWWDGQETALLDVAQDGNFTLRAHLRDSDPAPVEMAIGIDGRPLEQITLSRGDDSWETVTLPISLTRGFHSIDLRFLNDAIVNGKDRNAVAEWVTVER